MTITQYNSKNSRLTSASFEERNNLAEEDPWSRFRLGPKIRQARSGIRAKIHSWSLIHCVFKIRESSRFTEKNSQSVRSLRPNLSIRKPVHSRLKF